jgi:hypothetical protein
LQEIQRRILADRTCRTMSPSPIPVYSECSRQPDRQGRLFAQVMQALTEGLSQQCGRLCPPKVQREAEMAAEGERLRDAMEAASRWVFEESKRSFRVILLLDALHRISDEAVLQSLLGALNNEVDRNSVNVLLAGRYSVAHGVPKSVSDLRHLLTGHRALGPLDEVETKKLLAVAAKLGCVVDTGSAQQAYRLTAGHPYRLQYYLHAVLARHGRATPDGLLEIHTQATIEHLNNLLIESTGVPSHTPPSIFVSYSHKDEAEKSQLMSHLGVLGHAHRAKAWSDDQIAAGANWKGEIFQAIDGAKAAVLLITANSLTSDFILKTEVPRILDRRGRGGLQVVPIIGRPCPWQQHTWLTDMNVRPKNGDPVWRDSAVHADAKLTDIVNEIAQMLGPS